MGAIDDILGLKRLALSARMFVMQQDTGNDNHRLDYRELMSRVRALKLDSPIVMTALIQEIEELQRKGGN